MFHPVEQNCPALYIFVWVLLLRSRTGRDGTYYIVSSRPRSNINTRAPSRSKLNLPVYLVLYRTGWDLDPSCTGPSPVGDGMGPTIVPSRARSNIKYPCPIPSKGQPSCPVPPVHLLAPPVVSRGIQSKPSAPSRGPEESPA